MKTTKFGNILDCYSGIVVHGCNNKGVMGSGVAKQLRHQYPQIFDSYTSHLGTGMGIGTVDFVLINDQLVIANAITQDGYGHDGKKYVQYEAVQRCFKEIATTAKALSLPTGAERFVVKYPLIGAGLGGGDWSIISSIIDEELYKEGIDHELWIYE
jgi:O-acetyl-ADP-ribose deacetylase (regulator of RNase III)